MSVSLIERVDVQQLNMSVPHSCAIGSFLRSVYIYPAIDGSFTSTDRYFPMLSFFVTSVPLKGLPNRHSPSVLGNPSVSLRRSSFLMPVRL